MGEMLEKESMPVGAWMTWKNKSSGETATTWCYFNEVLMLNCVALTIVLPAVYPFMDRKSINVRRPIFHMLKKSAKEIFPAEGVKICELLL